MAILFVYWGLHSLLPAVIQFSKLKWSILLEVRSLKSSHKSEEEEVPLKESF